MNIYIYDNENASQRQLSNNLPKKIANLTKKIDNLNFESKDIVILPDSNFNFFSQNLSFYQKDKFTIKDFKNTLLHIKKNIKGKIDLNIESNNYLIDNIYINQQKQKDVFGHSGNIAFDIHILSPHNICIAKSLPKNLGIIKYLHKVQSKSNFVILYINDKNSQLITVKNGFYNNIYELNLGINQIKKDMAEDNVLQFMYDSQVNNIVTQRIIGEKYTYFAKLLTKRLKNNINIGEDIYIFSKLTKSESFMGIIKNSLNKLSGGYVLPLNNILPKDHNDNIYISSMILSGLL